MGAPVESSEQEEESGFLVEEKVVHKYRVNIKYILSLEELLWSQIFLIYKTALRP